MAERTRMFSEHWYRVAQQRVTLRPSVRARRQLYRGEVWRVLYDPFAHQFFRLRPEAYDFIARLTPDRTVEEVWHESLERDPDGAPGQEEVIRLLAQLYQSNLLQLDVPPDAELFFERYRRRTGKERQALLLHVMFARFPLLDPDRMLNVLAPYVRAVFSRIGMLVWLAVIFAAIKTAIDNADRLLDQSQGILAPGNLFLLYVGLALSKTIHEFGHAFTVKRFGGEVHTMGIMLMIFTPIPYIDATASWAFRRRRERILVASSGMIAELFVAAVAVFVWASTGPGTLNAICYNMMFIASVSTILFNGNPLLRYDGYYILADLLDIPNMYTRAQQQLRYLAEGKLLGRRGARPATRRRGEAVTMVAYGILSGVYRVIVFSSIILFVGRRFLVIGIIMAAICAVSWILVPTGRFIHYLVTDPALDRNRGRAIGVSAAAAAALAALIALIPMPASFSAPGVLQAVDFAAVPARAAGALTDIAAVSGRVSESTVLARLEDSEWPHEWAAETASRSYAHALLRRALHASRADIGVIEKHLELIRRRLDLLEERRLRGDVRPPLEGVWVSGATADMTGLWVERGMVLGYVIDPSRWVFRAIVSQEEANRLFDDAGPRGARVRLRGSAGTPLEIAAWRVVPGEQSTLPSPALGWLGGGEVAVSAADHSGLDAAETFFEVRADLRDGPGGLALFHGRTGRIRFRVAPETLWEQGYRRLRQLMHRRA